jgi:glutaredoxin
MSKPILHVLTASYCPYCVKLKEKLKIIFTEKEMKKRVKYYNTEKQSEWDAFENKFQKYADDPVPLDYNTIPRIVMCEGKKCQFVGGYTDFIELMKKATNVLLK